MQQILEHCGVSIAAITGVLAARGKQVDLFGVSVPARMNMIVGILAVLLLSLADIRWRITLPVFRPEAGPDSHYPHSRQRKTS